MHGVFESDVIIVGAGISGLAAARALSRLGRSVVVLEGRNRIGGRIHTEDGFDWGAHWIHGSEGNPLAQLVRQLGLQSLFVGGDSTYTGGWRDLAMFRGPDDRLSENERLTSILLADAFFEALDHWRSENPAQDESLDAFLTRFCAQQRLEAAEARLLRWHLTLLAREDCAGGLSAVSARSWDEGYEVFGMGDSTLVGGFGQICERLAAGLDIRLNTLVSRIAHASGGVTIETSGGTYRAPAAIVSVPLGVLKSGAIRFDPELPAGKRAAVDRLGFGNLAKVLVQFEEMFWPPEQYVFGIVSGEGHRHPTVVINLHPTHGMAALVMLAGGELGAEVEAMPSETVQAWVTDVLAKMFGPAVPQPVSVKVSGWSVDPLARGSYSFMRIGSSPSDIAALAAPFGDTLYFAGEATCQEHWGSAHGAYVSGLRAAAALAGEPALAPTHATTESRRWRAQLQRVTRLVEMRIDHVGADEIGRRRTVLKSNPVFGVIADEDLTPLAAMFDDKNFAAGEMIYASGDEAREVLVVVQGSAEIISERGNVVAVAERGSMIGTLGLFARRARSTSLRARDNTQILSLDYARFRRLLHAFPATFYELFRETVEHLLERLEAPLR